MIFRHISGLLGSFLFIFSSLLLIPLSISVFDRSFKAFLETFLLTITAATFLYLIGGGEKVKLYRKEGIAAVVIIWFLVPMIGSLPFLLDGAIQNPYQAYFEMVSGFTTTGASILVDIESVPRALLFWRSFSQWVGGGGIVILFVAILPAVGGGGKILVQTEITGPIKDTLSPRVKSTAIEMWKIYVGMTCLQLLLTAWLVPHLPFFDNLTVTLSTVSTGGFSIRNQGVGVYNSPILEWIICLFMTFGSINFTLFYYLIRGRFYRLKDPELYLFFGIVSLFSICGIFYLKEQFGYEAPRLAIFHIISAMTSCGFSTTNYDLWPYPVTTLMLIAMFVGGMSGSTAGGMKILRQLFFFRGLQNRLESLFRPETVRSLTVGGKEIDQKSLLNAFIYLFTLIAMTTLGAFLYVLDGIKPDTAFGLMACMINNVGLGFGEVGPSGSMSLLSNFSLLTSSLWMVLGRLELIVVLALLSPTFWKN